MARMARAVAPGIPHHVTQRGNRRQRTFFSGEDCQACLELMAEWCGKREVRTWAYCPMPDHVHLIVVPATKDGLKLSVGEARRRYTRRINFREGRRGRLRQGRFSSFMMDERYLLACARYVEPNPARAGLAKQPEDWPWSSAKAHIDGKDDILVSTKPLLEIVGKKWRDFLKADALDSEMKLFGKHERTGRPLDVDSFVEKMERLLNRKLKPQKPGPKTKDK